MDKKIFSEKQVDLSAVLGGPIPAGILIYKNYKGLGKDKQAYNTLAVTFIFTIAFFYGLMQLPEAVLDRIPNMAFTAFYGVLTFLFFRRFLADDVNHAFDNGAIKASNWTVAGFTLLGLALNFLIVMAIAVDQPYFEGKLLEVDGNELYYDSDSVPIEDVNKLVVEFKSNDFFGSDYGNIAKLELSDENYLITMAFDESLWSDSEIIGSLTAMKWLLEVEFGRKTELKLESVSLSGILKYKDI